MWPSCKNNELKKNRNTGIWKALKSSFVLTNHQIHIEYLSSSELENFADLRIKNILLL